MDLVILIGLVSTILVVYKIRNGKQDPKYNEMYENINSFNAEVEMYKQEYFMYDNKTILINKYNDTYEFFSTRKYRNTKDEYISNFNLTFSYLHNLVIQWNEEYCNRELDLNKALFDNIDGKSLDNQQRKAIVVDEKNSLILAGAGSGKTLTISGKVKYLVDVKRVKPEEILLISFTKKAADEMTTRIANRLNINIESKTFHKLGLDIITKHNNKRLEVVENLSKVIDEYFENSIFDNDSQIINMINFFSYYINIPKNLENYNSLGELYEEEKSSDFETLQSKYNKSKIIEQEVEALKGNRKTIQGEVVKSLEEVQIANFLFLNSVKYEYERLYPFEQEDQYKKSYRPDFYLPDYDIYIEHFGITKDGKVPWLSEVEETKYQEGIEWKRETHKKNKTKLIETYSYYNSENRLLIELSKMLKERGVRFKEADYLDIYDKIYKSANDKYFSEFKKLISSFISLFKSNGYDEYKFDDLLKESLNIKNDFIKQRNLVFLNIVKPIYSIYQNTLKESGNIDFNDMINLATDIIDKGLVNVNYKYIIIDEYQDISVSRYKLIRAIRNKTNAKIMCVGDDWQSIYRFAGSDIDLFTNFDKYFGYFELLRIEKTYRNSQELIDIAAKFVMSNPKQFKKNLKSDKHNPTPIVIKGYNVDVIAAIRSAINDIVSKFGEESTVIILGRNNFDIDFIEASSNFEFKLFKSRDQVKVKYVKYPKLQINYLTAHRSKGLEADNVIIINLENKQLGFPNKISDDPVLSLVLTDKDEYNYAEERRLFYVGLTRTKNTTYLIVPDRNPSIFIGELRDKINVINNFNSNEKTIQKNPNCPKCKTGILVLRENNNFNTKFLGCSNFPRCDYTIKYVDVLENKKVCPRCGGFIIKKHGPYGYFNACTNYPYCNYKEKM